MKALLKITGLILVIVTMVYNINLSMSKDSHHVSLAYVRNLANAQNENPTTYYAKQTASGHSTFVHVNTDSSTCTENFDFTKTVCSGTGSLDCKNEYKETNVVYSGSCPYH